MNGRYNHDWPIERLSLYEVWYLQKNGNCVENQKNSIILTLRDFETISILFDDDGFLQKIIKKST